MAKHDEEKKASKRSENGGCAKFSFTACIFSSFVIAFTTTGTHQVYILNYGAPIETMTVLLSVISFWGAFNELILGYLQDIQALAWLFPIVKWGRRAPWYVTSTVVGSLCVVFGSLVQPMNLSGSGLCVMYFVCNFVSSICYSNIGIAFSSAVIEIFPFNEERMEVEGFSVIWALLGVVVGTAYTVVALGDIKGTNTFPVGVVAALLSFVGMLGVPLMKQAQRPAEKVQTGYFASMAECLKNRAFMIYCGTNFFDGMGGGLFVTFFTYYFQFVCGVSVTERGTLFFLAILTTLFAQLFMAPVWGCLAFNKAGGPIREVTIACYVLNIITIPCLFFLAPFDTKAERINMFFGFVAVTRIFYSPRSFWSTAARDWAIDEDIQVNFKAGSVEQKRKEASYTSVSRFFQNLGSAVAVSAFYSGFFSAGFDSQDCRVFDPKSGMDKFLVEPTFQANFDNGYDIPTCDIGAMNHRYGPQCCKGLDRQDYGNLTNILNGKTVFKYDTFYECCYEQQRLTQPESVINYLKNLYGIALPVLHFCTLIFVILFPIHGERLKKLYVTQAKQLKDEDVTLATPVDYGKTEAALDSDKIEAVDLARTKQTIRK